LENKNIKNKQNKNLEQLIERVDKEREIFENKMDF
jgi:hypothetical protein